MSTDNALLLTQLALLAARQAAQYIEMVQRGTHTDEDVQRAVGQYEIDRALAIAAAQRAKSSL